MKNVVVAVLVVLGALLPARAEPSMGVPIPIPDWTLAPTSPPVFGTPDMVRLHQRTGAAESQAPDDTPWGETGDGIVDLLADEVRAAGGAIEEGNDVLLVSGLEEAVDLARRRVAAIDRFLTGRSRVAVQLVALSPRGRPEDLRAADIGKGLEAGTARLLWTGRFDLRRGEGGLRESLTERSFVCSHDAPVAQDASITEPRTALLRTGRRVFVSCRPVSGTEALVTLSLGLSRAPGEIREVQVATGSIDLPEVPFLSLTTDLRLAAGTSDVILVDHPFEPGLLAVVVSLLDLTPSDDLPFALVDLAALVGHPDAVDAFSTLGVGVLPGEMPRPGGYDEEYGPASDERRKEIVSSLLAALEETGVQVVGLSPVVVAIAGSAAARERAQGILARADTHGRVTRLAYRLPWSELAAAAFFDPLTGAVATDVLLRAAEQGEGLERTGTLVAGMAGRTHLLLLRGTWRRFLESMEVSIAQGAALVRPVVGTYVDGEVIVVRPGDVGGRSRPWLSRSSSALLGLDTRDLEVRRDIMGERSDEWGHKFDVLHTADAHARFALDEEGSTDLHRVGETAVIHIWSR